MGNKQSRMRKQGIYTAPAGTYIPPSYGPAYPQGQQQGYATSGGYYGGAPQASSQKRWRPKKTGGYGK